MSASLLLTRNTMNPDEDFVLHGRPASFWEKTGYSSNSGLTTTTARLSQHATFNPENYRERKYARTLSDLASNLRTLSQQVDNTLNKSVTFKESNKYKYATDRLSEPLPNVLENTKSSMHDTLRTDITEDELAQLYEDRVELDTLSGKPSTPKNSQWFMDPNHLSTTAVTPNLQSVGMAYRRGEQARSKYSDRDKTALENFPVTLGSAYELCALEYPQAESMSFSAPPSMRKSRSRSASRIRRTQSCKARDDFDRTHDVDMMYLMTKEAPTISSAEVFRSSPHQIELGKLRLERLKLEESKLLELKRLEELERIRGPSPKWYESKGLNFHYESSKNTALIRNEKRLQDLLDYREDLLRTSYKNLKTYSRDWEPEL